MDLLTVADARAETGCAAVRRSSWLAVSWSVYIVVTVGAILRHEPWADEAQSWLLARDASLFDLWGRLLHYEGTTGLWQTLLHVLAAFRLPYAAMSAAGLAAAVAAAAVILREAPFPIALRLAVPFTYYLCYQYAIIARSYNLLPLLVFLSAAWFEQAVDRPLRLTVVLCLTAAVSVHGLILAAAVAGTALRWGKLKPAYVLIFAAVCAVLIYCAWPASDQAFVPRLNLSPDHWLDTVRQAFANAFTGESITSFVLVALSLPLLWRGRALAFFLLAAFGLCTVDAIVYAQVWHFGTLLLAWITALWLACRQIRTPRLWELGPLAAVVAIQICWTAAAVTYDIRNDYSGAHTAAQGIRELDLHGRRLFGIGFACVAIQPYFSRNIFSNWNDGHPAAYWDWSTRNHVNEDTLHLAATRPDYVIVGYKNEYERGVWDDLVRNAGYSQIRHFEGNTFWQTRIFEPESFDLFYAGAH